MILSYVTISHLNGMHDVIGFNNNTSSCETFQGPNNG